MPMALWLSIGHREKDMLAAVNISWIATSTTRGNPAPPYSGSAETAVQPLVAYCW